MTETRTEKACSEFTFKNCRIANSIENLIILSEQVGPKTEYYEQCGIFSRRKLSSEKVALGNCSAIVKTVEIFRQYFNLMTGTLDSSAQLLIPNNINYKNARSSQ